MGTGGEQRRDRVGEHFTRHVVEVGLELDHRGAGRVDRGEVGRDRFPDHHLHHVGPFGRVGGAGAIADRLDRHRRRRTEPARQRGHESRTRRGGHLERRVEADGRRCGVTEQGDGGRCRVGDQPVGTADGAGADGDRAAADVGDAERFERRAGTDHVDDRVERTHLVQLDVGGVDAVDGAFDRGEPGEHGSRPGAHPLGEFGPLEEFVDLPHRPMGHVGAVVRWWRSPAW